ncbi:MmgE/PrpD family protein [Dactylosporangium sp. CA-233914]|uniref:MmgE/PrpD family protein n=1 Tax=Dactylosporangium sp. CA-233914 TaxID=3239934 RepID=UPI003D91ED18
MIIDPSWEFEMDETIRSIAEYAAKQTYDDLPDVVRSGAVKLALDALGCAIGGLDSDQARIARRLVPAASPGDLYAGVVLGSSRRGGPEQAAYANTCAIRYLDYNDFYPGSHPSDMVGALAALAGQPGVTGRNFITGLVVAYEVSARIADATQLREKGWDQGYAIGLGAVAGLGSMLGCSAEVIREALAICATANVPLRNTRAGSLSMWKGAATAYAVRNATFAMMLAIEGMTGPAAPIEGRHGLWELVSGRFTLDGFPDRVAEDFRLLRTSVKPWPVEYNATAAVAAALQLREQVRLEDLDKISIGTHWSSWHEIGSDPAKWDPRTRETADHSMPYLFARAMVDGAIDLATFEPAAYLDESLRPQMAKISVYLDDGCEQAFPEHIRLTVAARARNGEKFSFVVLDPPGYWRNPLTFDQVAAKFRALAAPVIGQERTAGLIAFWTAVDERSDVTPGLLAEAATP